MRGTHCSEVNKERLFCSDFAICEWNILKFSLFSGIFSEVKLLFGNCSLGTSFGLCCSDFISVDGTFCFKKGISDFSVP